ncbi:MAG: hypothetical protein KBG28_29800 [Kofleriaceae bacterium]|jgi:hypothetical protein|nr:hypothetical protein [Kofleriaceae bacterium]MBP9208200.1 hypothetical protein [Kofleriaceae bacterium]
MELHATTPRRSASPIGATTVLVLALVAAACGDDGGGNGSGIDAASGRPDAGSAGPDAAATVDAEAGLPTTCDGACRAMTLTAAFGAVSHTFDRAFYGLTVAGATTTLYVEASLGAAAGCPTASSPTPDYTFRLANLALPTSTASLPASGGLIDFVGDLLPTVPTASAMSTSVIPVAASLCPTCVGQPAPSDPDGLIAVDVVATFSGAASGVVSGRAVATHCDSLDVVE